MGGYNDLDDAYSRPYETCYYNCDTAALQALDSSCYCWSKSYYHGDDWGWANCPPVGGRPWKQFNKGGDYRMTGQDDEMEPVIGQDDFCGTPCQDFDNSVPTCPI